MTTVHTPAEARIVVGVDGSSESKQALRWAASIAAVSGAHIEAIAVWQDPVGYAWVGVPYEWNPGDDAEKALNQAVDEVFGTDRPDNLRLLTHEGHATRVLLDASKGALMLIVGSRGHGGFGGLLLGSVSAAVAEHASCPVLVVHGDQEPPAARS